TKVTHIKVQTLSQRVHACRSPVPTLPAHLLLPQHTPLSISLICFNPCCGFPEYIFGLINSWYPAPQLLLALTQTTTHW
ncbi:unnamed protein product, partial [Hymenolepis diminuta]